MNNFYDRKVQFGNRYKLKSLGNDIVELTRYEGTVYQEGTELNANNLNGIKTELDNKRDKSTKIKSSDLDTSADSNKIKQVNLSEEVKQMMVGNTPINAVPANKSITEEKVMNNSLSSYVFKGAKGRIMQSNAIQITLGTTIKATSTRNISVYYDKTSTYVTNRLNVTLDGTSAKEFILYINMVNNQLEFAKASDVTMTCLVLANIYYDTGAQYAVLHGNDNAITVTYNGVGVQDKLMTHSMGVVSYWSKINITYVDNVLDIAFLNNVGAGIFANGKVYSNVSLKDTFTVTDVMTGTFNLLFDTTKKKLFFRYEDTDVALYASDNNNIVLLCSFYLSGIIVNMATQSTHNILFNGVDNTDKLPIVTSDKLWSKHHYAYGLDKTKANMLRESYGSEVRYGMLSTVCSDNSRWNSYDSGLGGHGLEIFARDLSYRLTFLIDKRETDEIPTASIQLFQYADGSKKAFGWTRIGTDDSSRTNNGDVGGWQFSNDFAYSNCPTRYRKRPLPTSLPTNNKSDTLELDDCPIIACDLNGDLRQWDYETKTWYKLITEKELSQTEMINNKLIGVEHALIMLPNKLRNLSKVENGKIFQVKKVGLRVLNGTENWAIITIESGEVATMFHCGVIDMEQYVGGDSAINMVSDKGICKYVTREDALGDEDIIIMGKPATSYGFRMLVRNTLATDVASLKTYLASNNIKVYYQLANEVTTEIIV